MRRMLVVDDDPGARETYQAALQHAGYRVDLAASGSAAIATLSSEIKPHALLLDVKLGDMTGYDVLRWMRAQPVVAPTAVMTAFRDEFDPDEAIALGAMAYVDQPLTLDDVCTLAESLTSPLSPQDDPQRLHGRVLAGHPGALDCLDLVLLQVIPQRLARAFPRVPWDFRVDAATDACLEYGANPKRLDTARSSLFDYVYLIAKRNLVDRLRAEAARTRRETRYAREQTAASCGANRQADMCLCAALSAVVASPKERRAVEKWLDAAGDEAIATALGLGQLAPNDRRSEIKRFKDRLLKRLSRYFRPAQA